MKSRYVICFFFMCLIMVAAFGLSYEYSLNRSLPEATSSSEESPHYIEVQAPKELIVTTDMMYYFETYNQSTDELLEELRRIPVEFLGKTREEMIVFLEKEGQALALSEPEFISLKLLTFSKHQLIVRKVVAKNEAYSRYFLTLENNTLVVYNEDRINVFLYTNILAEELPEEIKEALEVGIILENADALYDYLESCTS